MLASVPVAYLLDALTLGQLFVVALLAGAGQVLFSTAYPPFFVALVPRESYLDANSKLSASRSVSFVAGPAVGGALVQLFSAPVAVLVDAATFLFSAFQIGRVDVEERPRDTAESSLLSRAREGLGLVVRHPVLRAGLGCATTINFFTFMVSALVILFASRTLGLSAGVIGLAFGIGALAGRGGRRARAPARGALRRRPGDRGGRDPVPGAARALALAGGPTWAAATVLAVVEFVSALGVMCFDVNLNSLQTRRHPGRGPQPCRRRVQHDQLRHPAARRGRRRAPRDVCGRARDARARRDRGDVVDPLAAALADSVCALARGARASGRKAGRRRARARG